MAATTGVFAIHGTATTGIFQAEVMEARDAVRVINRGSTDIYFTVASDGVTPPSPAVTGVDSYVVPGVAGAVTTVEAGAAPVSVSLVCSGTSAFSVIGGNPGLIIER